MAVGTHTVEVFADPNAGAWSAPLDSNSTFDVDAAGWKACPMPGALPAAPALTWAGGKISGSGMTRDPVTGPIARPVGVTTYRVRAQLHVTQAGNINFGVAFGATAADASAVGGASHYLHALIGPVPVGDYTIEQVFDATPVAAAKVFVTPVLQLDRYPAGGTVAMVVDSLVLDYQLPVPASDLSCLVDQLTITHGRDGATGQPDPAACTLDITVTPDEPLPATVELGAVLMVTTATPTLTSTRFIGRITDISLGWEDAEELTPDSGVGQITCTALMADAGRRWTLGVYWPPALDGERVRRIFVEGFGNDVPPLVWDYAHNDPGRVQMITVESADNLPSVALDAARAVADDAAGMVWHTREGQTLYADQEHRRGTQVSLELDACDLLVTPTWKKTLDGLINDVTIGYGPGIDGAEQATSHGADAASKAKYGPLPLTAATKLAAQADADAMVRLILARNTTPVWVMASLPVDMIDLDPDRTDALLRLDVHSLINLTGLPAIGTAPTTAVLWVEGWSETLAFGEHDIALNVSGFCRTAPPPRWDDLDPALTWDTTPAAWTWDSVACLGPTVSLGRWTDVPASLRWDGVAPAITWNTYA